MSTESTEHDRKNYLLDAPGLLAELFPPGRAPSIRWLRKQVKDRRIPMVRIGRLCFFDPAAVRAAIAKRTVQARN